jgi:NADPH-dependent curcumin reductase CurA
MISQYNATEPPTGPRNIILAVGKSLRLEGFIVSNHWDMMEAFTKDLAAWHAAGKLKWRDTVKEGIEAAPEAFLGLFSGQNFGKMLVKL